MTRREMVIAAIRHQETPRCPYTFQWDTLCDGPNCADALDQFYGGPEWRTRFGNFIVNCARATDGKLDTSKGPLRRDVYGTLWRMDLKPFHLEEPALKEPSLRGYRMPDPDLMFPPEWEKTFCAEVEACRDRFTVGTIGFGLFERAWSLRGFENFLMDVAAEPAFAADVVAALAEHQIQLIDRLLALPLDGVMFSDDWGAQHGVIIGPERWRELIKPHTARLYARVKKADRIVLTHCCGSVVDILPDIIEIGLDVLESVQPEARGMNPYELKRRYGGQLAFWGGLGSQSLIPFGTPDQLRTEIRRLVSDMTRGGGYILSCAKPLQVGTPAANAAAILEEFTAAGEISPTMS